MQPSDRSVDRDADPTRVRPDRLDPADLFAEPDASPTTVRPRFPSATPVEGHDAQTTGADPAGVDPTGVDALGRHTDGTHTGGRHAGGWDTGRGDTGGGDTGGGDTDGADSDGTDTGGADTDGTDTDIAPRLSGLWAEPGRQGAGATSAAVPSAGPMPWGEGDAGAQLDFDGGPTTVLTVARDSEPRPRRRDWAWVEEWRAERSAPAWAPGIAVGTFVALIVAVALIVLTSGVSDSPVLAVVFNVVIAAGMAPALWLCRSLPVLRFLAAGAAAGIVFGWIAMLTTF